MGKKYKVITSRKNREYSSIVTIDGEIYEPKRDFTYDDQIVLKMRKASTRVLRGRDNLYAKLEMKLLVK